MAVDTTIPHGEPGVASFATESFGNTGDIRFGDTPVTTTTITVTAGPTGLTLPLYAVISASGVLADQAGVAAADRANYVTAEPVTIAAGATATIPVYRTGHFNMDAMVWGPSYTTDAQKSAAFEGSVSPGIFVSKPKHNSDAIL